MSLSLTDLEFFAREEVKATTLYLNHRKETPGAHEGHILDVRRILRNARARLRYALKKEGLHVS